MMCRYCDQPLAASEAVKTYGYWSGGLYWVHAACKVPGEQQEAYDCQLIDADCNDCRYFVRDRMESKWIWQGRCTNPNRNPRWDRLFQRVPRLLIDQHDKVYAYPKFFSGHPCFLHRRAPC